MDDYLLFNLFVRYPVLYGEKSFAWASQGRCGVMPDQCGAGMCKAGECGQSKDGLVRLSQSRERPGQGYKGQSRKAGKGRVKPSG